MHVDGTGVVRIFIYVKFAKAQCKMQTVIISIMRAHACKIAALIDVSSSGVPFSYVEYLIYAFLADFLLIPHLYLSLNFVVRQMRKYIANLDMALASYSFPSVK